MLPANVTFRFDFELSEGVISKGSKSTLFQNILSDLGLGAKTNVGYGKFEHFVSYETEQEIEQEKIDRENRQNQESQRIANIADIVEKCKTIIDKYDNASEQLFKELRDVEIDSDSDKLKIQEYFADKYTGTGKFIKKINNLLSR